MIRINFSDKAKREIALRATDMSGNIYCELCGKSCPTRADYEIDHCVAEGMRPEDLERGPLGPDDGKLLCLECHDKKTRRDIAEIARAKRLGQQHRVITQGQTEIARRFKVKQETR